MSGIDVTSSQRQPLAPCEVIRVTGAYRVNDREGRAICYVYFAKGARQASMPDLWSPEEAHGIAKRIARGFTRADVTSKGQNPEKGGLC